MKSQINSKSETPILKRLSPMHTHPFTPTTHTQATATSRCIACALDTRRAKNAPMAQGGVLRVSNQMRDQLQTKDAQTTVVPNKAL